MKPATRLRRGKTFVTGGVTPKTMNKLQLFCHTFCQSVQKV